VVVAPPPASTPSGLAASPGGSVTDLAERSLNGRDAVKVVPVGCTASPVRRIIVRDVLALLQRRRRTPVSVAGEATLTIDEKQQALTPGWYAQVPRNTSSASPIRRNPAFVSLLVGRPCGSESVELIANGTP
jgi:hypothetical protein